MPAHKDEVSFLTKGEPQFTKVINVQANMDGEASAIIEAIYDSAPPAEENIKYCMMDAQDRFVTYTDKMKRARSSSHSHNVLPSNSNSKKHCSSIQQSLKIERLPDSRELTTKDLEFKLKKGNCCKSYKCNTASVKIFYRGILLNHTTNKQR